MGTRDKTLCPSAQHDWEGSQIIGVVGGNADEPEVVYLKSPQPLTDELLEQSHPVTPAEVFRFSAPCACNSCVHYTDEESKCRLAEKVVRWAPKVVDNLPTCAIRADCRWWQQEGREACERCPQVVTNNLKPSKQMRKAADPAEV